jgi:hypothetical protein
MKKRRKELEQLVQEIDWLYQQTNNQQIDK